MAEDREVKQVVCEELCVTKLCVTKLYVNDGVLQRKTVCVTVVCEREVVTKLCERCAKKAQRTVVKPFYTKQTKDITVRCNRLYSNLHTQVSHANVISIAKSPMSQ